MMDAHSRRELALKAISDVLGGGFARDVETDLVDFKEEEGTIDRNGHRAPIDIHHEHAARKLAEEVACLANGINGGVLVVGVNDKAAGAGAFVGSYLDTTWLRDRIHALTQPNLSLDILEEQTVAGARIYLINVPPAIEEVRCGDKLRTRFGTRCEELTGDRAREFLEQRRHYDWSATPSGLHLSDADANALVTAHQLYSAAQGRKALSGLDLVQRLHLELDDTENPELSTAGALLLCRYEPDLVRLEVRIARSESAPASVNQAFKAPLVLAFADAWKVIDQAFPEQEPLLVGYQRRTIRPIPEQALREALVNALMHRDYRLPRASVLALSLGNPPNTFKVRSPGGFPPGIDSQRLLAARSLPRNPVLAVAMRTLGYAEGQGIGIPTMYRVLLRDGHPQPEIYNEGTDVTCRLPGGALDTEVRGFFDNLYAIDDDLKDDVRVHIAITMLLGQPTLRVEDLSKGAQCSHGEALEEFERMSKAGAVERLLDGSLAFRLTQQARGSLQKRIQYKTRDSLEVKWDKIRAFLDSHDSIGRSEAIEILGTEATEASNTLSVLYNKRGRLEPIKNARGRGVRYRLVTAEKR